MLTQEQSKQRNQNTQSSENWRDQRPVGYGRRGSSLRGKIWLVAIFLILMVFDIVFYFALPEQKRSHLNAPLINDAIWYIVLLTAIWNHQNWARYIFIFFLLLSLGTYIIQIPDLLFYSTLNFYLLLFIASAVARVAIVWFLIYSADIKRLTSKFFNH